MYCSLITQNYDKNKQYYNRVFQMIRVCCMSSFLAATTLKEEQKKHHTIASTFSTSLRLHIL